MNSKIKSQKVIYIINLYAIAMLLSCTKSNLSSDNCVIYKSWIDNRNIYFIKYKNDSFLYTGIYNEFRLNRRIEPYEDFLIKHIVKMGKQYSYNCQSRDEFFFDSAYFIINNINGAEKLLITKDSILVRLKDFERDTCISFCYNKQDRGFLNLLIRFCHDTYSTTPYSIKDFNANLKTGFFIVKKHGSKKWEIRSFSPKFDYRFIIETLDYIEKKQMDSTKNITKPLK